MINKNYNLTNLTNIIPTINNVIIMYLTGHSAKYISKKHNLSTGDIYKILTDNNIEIRKGNSGTNIKRAKSIKINNSNIENNIDVENDLTKFLE